MPHSVKCSGKRTQWQVMGNCCHICPRLSRRGVFNFPWLFPKKTEKQHQRYVSCTTLASICRRMMLVDTHQQSDTITFRSVRGSPSFLASFLAKWETCSRFSSRAACRSLHLPPLWRVIRNLSGLIAV